MAQSFSNFPQQAYKGTPYLRNVALYTPRTDPPRSVPIDIDWIVYGVSSNVQRMGVLVDLSLGPSGALLNSVRSVYIDNTFSAIAIYVQFLDTGYTVVCPPGSVVISPVLTNNLKAIIYGEGFTDADIPKTSVTFMNIELAGFYIPTNFEILPDLSYLANTGQLFSATPVVALNVPLGVDTPDRLSIFALQYHHSFRASTLLLDSVTVNGIPATIHVATPLAVYGVAIVSAPVPGGVTQATLSAAFTGVGAAAVTLAAGSYRLVNQQSNTPITAISQGAAVASRNVGIAYAANAVGVYTGSLIVTGAPNFPVLNNALLNYTLGGQEPQVAGMYETIAAQANRIVTLTPAPPGNFVNNLAGAVWR